MESKQKIYGRGRWGKWGRRGRLFRRRFNERLEQDIRRNTRPKIYVGWFQGYIGFFIRSTNIITTPFQSTHLYKLPLILTQNGLEAFSSDKGGFIGRSVNLRRLTVQMVFTYDMFYRPGTTGPIVSSRNSDGITDNSLMNTSSIVLRVALIRLRRNIQFTSGTVADQQAYNRQFMLDGGNFNQDGGQATPYTGLFPFHPNRCEVLDDVFQPMVMASNRSAAGGNPSTVTMKFTHLLNKPVTLAYDSTLNRYTIPADTENYYLYIFPVPTFLGLDAIPYNSSNDFPYVSAYYSYRFSYVDL